MGFTDDGCPGLNCEYLQFIYLTLIYVISSLLLIKPLNTTLWQDYFSNTLASLWSVDSIPRTTKEDFLKDEAHGSNTCARMNLSCLLVEQESL